MIGTLRPSAIETLHPVTDDGIEAERAVLAALAAHFVGTAATPREAYDAMTATTPIAEGVAAREIRNGTRGWWVTPPGAPRDRAILFIHGGAYLLGSAQAYRGFASQVASRAGVAAFVLDYPLAPEHRFPAAYDATVAARRWLGTQGITQLALVGDSAGGGLALAALNTPEAPPRVASVVALSPWVDLALEGQSMSDPETRDPIFKPPMLASAASTYLAGADPRDGRASPLYAIPERLPPIAIQVGSDELLLDDARRYAAKAAAGGGMVQLDIYEGLHHVFQRATAQLPAARKALDQAAAFVTRHWA